MVEYSERLKEDLKLGILKRMVDRVCRDMVDGRLGKEDAQKRFAEVREKAELLIPDMMDKYDMIYGSRFKRLFEQFVLEKDA